MALFNKNSYFTLFHIKVAQKVKWICERK